MDMNTSPLVPTGQIVMIKPHSSAMAIISKEGDVSIDWARVEQEAAGSDRYLKFVAQALIAVRDKTYKTIP